jgi:hypothetical protein
MHEQAVLHDGVPFRVDGVTDMTIDATPNRHLGHPIDENA